jgi:hypothetical protein
MASRLWLIALVWLALLAGASHAARSSAEGDVSAVPVRGCMAEADGRITATVTEWAWKSGTLHAAIVGATRHDTPVPAPDVRVPDRRAPESPPLITPLRI